MQNYIHFWKTEPGYNPLIKNILSLVSAYGGNAKCLGTGDKVTVDKSMMRYMGGATSFVQFMPRKPIKQGIKIFTIICAYTAALLDFEVFCGAEVSNDQDNSALGVVRHLIQKAYLTGVHGHTVYTDNWYTTMDLAQGLFQYLDVPFHKLSMGVWQMLIVDGIVKQQ